MYIDKAIQGIIKDLTDRRGLGSLWLGLDDGTVDEIRSCWKGIISTRSSTEGTVQCLIWDLSHRGGFYKVMNGVDPQTMSDMELCWRGIIDDNLVTARLSDLGISYNSSIENIKDSFKDSIRLSLKLENHGCISSGQSTVLKAMLADLNCLE